MITITTDEADAYDRLAILEIKMMRGAPVREQQQRLFQELETNCGVDYNMEITGSKEYEALYVANEQTFNLIDQLRSDGEWEGAAKDIDDANMKRYYAKCALQKRFFESPLKEIKL